MKQKISFILNKEAVSVEVFGDETLLNVLRIYLEKTGTKQGCGVGQCGSCTVLINNKAVRSCTVAIEDVAGAAITTIEGMAENEVLHPIQKAFVHHDALQCGFCTPGMIMNAYGLLIKDPEPTREKIISGMDANLCRCGSYNRIVDAIQSAAVEMKEKI
jgi:carbon-monoxide dehydrogenase small subunit